MTQLFQAQDKSRFGDMGCPTCHASPCSRTGQTAYAPNGCTTCHGADGMPRGFKMPAALLPKLSAADGFRRHTQASPKMTEFMKAVVVPEMARMLDEEITCFSCHGRADN
jgi:hypothetical protein